MIDQHETLQSPSITAKFIFWFLFVALTPLVAATILSYTNSHAALRKEVAKSLIAVADDKAFRLETYLREKEHDVTRLAQTSDIASALERFSNVLAAEGASSENYQKTYEEFRPLFGYYQRSSGFDGIFLLNSDGAIVFSSRGSQDIVAGRSEQDAQLSPAFWKTKESQKTEISDFGYSFGSSVPSVYIVAPVFKRTDFAGAVVAQMSNQGVSELVADYSGLGKTGEIILAARLDKEAVFITPQRFDADAAFKKKLPVSPDQGLDIQKALRGEKGFGMLRDYRAREVMSVWRPLPLFRWGLVVKMDTEEVFASAGHLRNILIAVSAALMVIVIIMAVMIARSIARPITQLTEVAQVISQGNLSARALVPTRDEIGMLAASFNQMADHLIEAKSDVEKKKAEVEDQKKLLEKVNKELDSFVYTASHDLRAPLRAIDGFASLLDKGSFDKLDEKGKHQLERIRAGVVRMDALIDDLLALSRVSRVQNPYEKVAISAVIREVTERIEFQIKENSVDLVVAQAMPVIECDRIKITEAFFNLISNAIKFSSKIKDGHPRVEVGYADRDDAHQFFVKDNGIGIEKKYHAEIFEIFRRLHSQDEYEGTGAGLTIVKKIIEGHGGSIWVESEIGAGATFYFTIPKSPSKA